MSRFLIRGEDPLHVAEDRLGERLRAVVIAGDHVAFAVDEILLKVPFHLAGEWALLGQVAIERMLVLALHANLAEQRKSQAVLRVTELFDLLVVAGLLLAEVVRRKRQ